MSGVGSSTISGTPSSFLILPASATFGRKSATAAAMTTTSAVGGERLHRRLHLRPRSRPATRSAPAGAGRSTVDTSVTVAPRASGLGGDRVALLAAAAVGDDAHGVDRFAGAAGGDDDMRAPCEVTGTEHPLDRGDDPLRVGQAARAGVAAGEAALLGLDDVHAAAAQRGDVVGTAGCSHISVCIAGQTITGARVASSTLVSRSVDRPAA